VDWNSHKGYLLSLGRSGVPVVPTVLLRQGTRSVLADIIDERSWGECIVKPAIGADAWQVARGNHDSSEVAQAQLDSILTEGDALVQPYFSSVEDAGERSLIYVDGQLTHAVRRPPVLVSAGGHGGTPELASPNDDETSVAEAALKTIGSPALYARVDLVRDNLGATRLLELELIEPMLFFALAPHAAERLAEAIASRIMDPPESRANPR
jgi:glutathione synthase/RimK-type ligase-like ATP-grasp enzyme